MMSVVVRVNGEEIDRCSIVNRGHPETGEHPADDDLRIYDVVVKGVARIVQVAHRRSEGSWALIAKVSAKLAEVKGQ